MGGLASPSQLRMSFIRWALVIVPLVVLLGIASGQLAGSGPENGWFTALQKPEQMPPNWAFGLIWSCIYLLIGLAFALICGARGARGRGIAITAFILQFILNLAWSPLFFAAHKVDLALYLIAVLFVAVAITTTLFWRIRLMAGLLMLPYLAWLICAGFLNYEIARLNPGAETLVPPPGGTQITF